MKSNFYEKIIPLKTEEKRNLIIKMDKLLNESIDVLIDLRNREVGEMDNTKKKLKMIEKFNEFTLSQRGQNNNENNSDNDNDNNNNFINRLRECIVLTHQTRLRRIMNMEEETENLNRLIENNNFESIG